MPPLCPSDIQTFRQTALHLSPESTLDERLQAYIYCSEHPADEVTLAITRQAMRADNSLSGRWLLDQLVRTPRRPDPLPAGTRVENPLFDANTPPPPPTIFIGVNHSGSWSTSEALTELLGQQRSISLDAYTFASSTADIPPLDHEIGETRKIVSNGLPDLRFIYSHRSTPIHLAFDQPTRYATFLRHPVSRFLALYFWVWKHRHMDVHWIPESIRNGMTLADFVDQVIETRIYPGGMRPGEYFFDSWRELGLLPEELKKSRKDGTKYVLEKHFSFIGITELFDESLFCMSRWMNLEHLPLWVLRGSSGRPATDTIDPAVLRKIDRLTEIDQEIYFHFRDRFIETYRDEINFMRKHQIQLNIQESGQAVWS